MYIKTTIFIIISFQFENNQYCLLSLSKEIKNTISDTVKQIAAIVFITGFCQSGRSNPIRTDILQNNGVRQICFSSTDTLDRITSDFLYFLIIVIISPVTIPIMRTISHIAHNIFRAIVL